MEHMCAALQYADDSNDLIGACVDQGLALLNELADTQSLAEDTRLEALAYCSEAFLSRRSQQETTLGIIRKFKGEEAAIAYMKQGISHHLFRKQLIEIAMCAQDFELARKLAQDGYAQDKDNARNYASDWLKIQLEIAKQCKGTTDILRLARQLFLENHDGRLQYYALLKETVGSKGWPEYVEGLIQKIQKTREKYLVHGRLAEIYAQEGFVDRLYELVRESKNQFLVEEYEKILAPTYKVELVEMWKDILVEYFKRCTGRNSYVEACRYLQKMKSLGGGEEAAAMAQFIREEFKKRPAFLDELRRAGF
jgi:hypothetical protein